MKSYELPLQQVVGMMMIFFFFFAFCACIIFSGHTEICLKKLCTNPVNNNAKSHLTLLCTLVSHINYAVVLGALVS